MDTKSYPPQEQDIQTLQIKNESLETESSPYIHEQVQDSTKKEIEFQETFPSNSDFDLKEEIKDYDEDPLKSVESTSNQDQDKLYKCEEPNCGETFKFMDNLSEHVAVHSGTKVFKCKETGCTKWFKRKNDLYRHVRVHSDERPYKCNIEECQKAFKAKNNLGAHMRLHSGVTPFKCDHENCNKSFKRKYTLDIHQRTHFPPDDSDNDNDEVIFCDFPSCSSTFKKKHYYYMHRRRHKHGRRFRCPNDDCDAAFFENKDLKNHIRLHTGERFLCSFKGCQRSFTAKNKLVSHQEIHSGVIHRCTYKNCAKTFKNNDGLRNHFKKHINEECKKIYHDQFDKLENTYQCSFCEVSFDEEEKLQVHLEGCEKELAFETVDLDKIKTENVTSDVACEIKSYNK